MQNQPAGFEQDLPTGDRSRFVRDNDHRSSRRIWHRKER